MAYRIGVDLGGTNIKTGVIDENHRIVSYDSRPTGAARPFGEVVADIAASAQTAAEKLGLDFYEFPCVGIGTPGAVERATGRVMHAGNFNAWDEVPLRDELQKYMPVPVCVSNDADCAAAGEAVAGAAKACKNVLLYTLGTGLGGGIILDGKIFSGADGLGAELGHTVLSLDGEPCTCGIRGCFEAYASVSALIRQTQRAMEAHPESAMCAMAAERGVVNGRTAFDCARTGDPAAREVVARYIRYVAAGVGGGISVFRPEVVLIGGGISNEGEYLLEPLRRELPAYVFGSAHNGVPPVRKAILGNDAGIIGAAYLDVMQK